MCEKKIKYPRTYHLPHSPGLMNDDRRHEDESFFEGKTVVVTEKRDGENCSMYRDAIHARSLDTQNHPSRDWVKALHGRIKYDIPEGLRICGENLYARHSIHYHHLPGTYFEVFSIWDRNVCLSWDETLLYVELLRLHTVPLIYEGVWARDAVHDAFNNHQAISKDEVEGYVVRVRDSFLYKDYKWCVAKYVRAKHVQTDEFWMSKPVVPNGLEAK
ncbi:MAG: 2'-5' RNA ligase [Candidatus Altiarchaeales archaeon]|nr:2'-5' RNA ligase [Candidatus Altiarchaeales archaeon]